MRRHRSWADLPVEILSLLLDRLHLADLARSAAVCTSWRSAAADRPHFRALNLPWLLLSQHPTTLTWGLYSPFTSHTYHLDLPVPPGSLFSGASHAYLIINSGIDGNCLLNPLTNRKIQLPHTPWGESGDYFKKAILSSSPEDNNCMVIVKHYCFTKLFFCRPGDKAWSSFPEANRCADIQDFIVREELLYCINKSEEVLVFKLLPQPRLEHIYYPWRIDHGTNLRLPPYTLEGSPGSPYLVESAGELLMVLRYKGEFYGTDDDDDDDHCECVLYGPSRFEVFKLDPTGLEWVPTKSLGDQMLFLGLGCSTSITVEAGESKFSRNCIYFTENDNIDEGNGPHVLDWGVFCLEDESVRPIYPNDYQCHSYPPLWVMLNS